MTPDKTGKSFITIKVDTSQVADITKSVIALQSTAVRRDAYTLGAVAARNAIRSYYSESGRGIWLNTALPTHGPGRKLTRWWERVESSWFVGKVTGSGVQISNGTVGLAHKITGGTIKAKRKKFLAIPMVPQAHGESPRDYAKKYKPLFAAKGFLMEATEDPEKPRAVYALRKSVTQAPWPNALPPEQGYINAFMESAVEHIINVMEGKS